MRTLGRIVMGLLLVVAVACVAAYLDYRAFLERPLRVPAGGLVLEIAPGTSVAGIAQRLAAQGAIDRPRYLHLHTRLAGLAASLQAGEYRIAPGTRPPELVEQLAAGRVIQYALTVVEGWTFSELLAAVHAHDAIHQTLEETGHEDLMGRLGRPGEHPEGWFFPDTYHFPRGTTDLAFLRRAHQRMERELDLAWEGRDADLPLDSPYEALILASIVEKETALAEERGEVAGVFVRRLRRRMPLQTDPTVIYGLGADFDGNLRRVHLRADDNPYNTYMRKGLPPSPIALPGRGALQAAVKPAPGDTLYFVSRGDGSHEFTSSLREHNEAVRRYQLNHR